MKKILSLLVVLAILTAGLLISAFAADDTVIAVEKTEAKAGEEVTVEVMITGNTGFAAASFFVDYDAEAMTLVAIDTQDCILDGASVNPEKGAVSFATTEDVTGDGKLFVLTFQVNEDTVDGVYAVSVTVRKLIHDDRTAVDATIEAGSITVVHACELVDVAEVPATCTENGTKAHQECAICGKLFVDGVEVTEADLVIVAGHTEEVLPGKEATCTETGLTEGKKCSVCGEILVAQEEIPAKGHTEEVIPGKEATCTETGLTEGKKCSVCGETLVAQEEIPAKGHTEEIIPGKEATCTEPGLTEGKKCAECGEILVEQEEIPALGHDFQDGKCENCGEEDPDYETPDTGSSIYLAMIAAMTSLVGIVVLTNKKRF